MCEVSRCARCEPSALPKSLKKASVTRIHPASTGTIEEDRHIANPPDPKQTHPPPGTVLKAATGAAVGALVVRPAVRHLWHKGREYLTHWAVAGLIVAVTGVAPEHWMADLVGELHIPGDALHLWNAGIDARWLAVGCGLALVVGDIAWRRTRAIPAAEQPSSPDTGSDAVMPPPDKPSIAVLPFTNLSGDAAQEYFSDGITEDIITELSRFRAMFVIARNSSFSYKDKPVDVRQVARELGVRYVLEGSARKAGDRARVTAQLVDAATGSHLWAEHYDRTLEDVFELQEDLTRGIVAAVAPQVELAEMAHARRSRQNDDAWNLTWHAQSLMNEGVHTGQPTLLQQAIDMARRAVTADPNALAAYNVVAWANWSCYLYRWVPDPAKALQATTDAVGHMARIDALDYRTLLISGVLRVVGGDAQSGLVDLRRSLEVNPNSSVSLMWLALCEAMAGLGEDAKVHAALSLRLNPRDTWVGIAQVALAIVSFHERDYAEAARLAELSIQSEPSAPFRRAIMVASCRRLGQTERAERELKALNDLAPDFVSGLLRGDLQMFQRQEDMTHLVDGLRMAGVEA